MYELRFEMSWGSVRDYSSRQFW